MWSLIISILRKIITDIYSFFFNKVYLIIWLLVLVWELIFIGAVLNIVNFWGIILLSVIILLLIKFWIDVTAGGMFLAVWVFNDTDDLVVFLIDVRRWVAGWGFCWGCKKGKRKGVFYVSVMQWYIFII